jgi:superfamily II DNA/RNA helicase
LIRIEVPMSDKTEQLPLPEAFAALGIRNSVLKGLAAAKFSEPSEIQRLLIPRALAGVDLLGQARTGTGKTAAFGIPLLCQCVRGIATQAIILVPTRELAVQVEAEIQRLAVHTPLRVLAIYGGQKISAQVRSLKHNPEILVGTPGRVMDLLQRRFITFSNIRFAVLDEVDRMLDIGFREDIRQLLGAVKSARLTRLRQQQLQSQQGPEDAYDDEHDRDDADGHDDGHGDEHEAHDERHLDGDRSDFDMEVDEEVEVVGDDEPAAPASPAPPRESRQRESRQRDDRRPAPAAASNEPLSTDVQTIFVSATISPEIERLARTYMRDNVEKLIAPGADEKPTVEKVEQWYFSVHQHEKYNLLRKLLEREQPELAIVFCRTKHGAERLAHQLHADGIECREIHGNLNQNKREKVMKNFRGGKFDVLVATDLASRGIDVADITHIVNYDIPEDPEVYVHRVGRTARMGATGKAYTFVTPAQGMELTKIEELIHMLIPAGTIEGFTPAPAPVGHAPGELKDPTAQRAAEVPHRKQKLGAKIRRGRRR